MIGAHGRMWVHQVILTNLQMRPLGNEGISRRIPNLNLALEAVLRVDDAGTSIERQSTATAFRT